MGSGQYGGMRTNRGWPHELVMVLCRWGVMSGLLVFTGCSSSQLGSSSGRPPDASDASGDLVEAIDASADSGTGDAQMGVATCNQPPVEAPPGPPVVDAQTAGSGACAARTLGQVLQAVYALQPDLADITAIHDATVPTLSSESVTWT